IPPLVKKKEKNLPQRATVPVTIEGVKTNIVEVGEIIQHLPEIQLVILMLGVFAHPPKKVYKTKYTKLITKEKTP
ncbi:hypothetical protein ACQGS6_24890, partial [Bacillus sp. GMs2/2]|uniref:hypothetical protein n=1 Tax=Bacillus sp. GMs2/2 TaxID=3418494 RepID=UPI003CECE527